MRNIIKKHSDFLMAEDSPKYVMPAFVLRARITKFPGDAQYGITVTKKCHKHATDRNRAKRKIRVWIRENAEFMRDDMDYVFIIRQELINTPYKEGMGQVKRAIKKVSAQG